MSGPSGRRSCREARTPSGGLPAGADPARPSPERSPPSTSLTIPRGPAARSTCGVAVAAAPSRGHARRFCRTTRGCSCPRHAGDHGLRRRLRRIVVLVPGEVPGKGAVRVEAHLRRSASAPAPRASPPRRDQRRARRRCGSRRRRVPHAGAELRPCGCRVQGAAAAGRRDGGRARARPWRRPRRRRAVRGDALGVVPRPGAGQGGAGRQPGAGHDGVLDRQSRSNSSARGIRTSGRTTSGRRCSA